MRHRTAAQVSLPTGYWLVLEEMERKGMIKDRSAGVKRGVELLAEEKGMTIHLEEEEQVEPTKRK